MLEYPAPWNGLLPFIIQVEIYVYNTLTKNKNYDQITLEITLGSAHANLSQGLERDA